MHVLLLLERFDFDKNKLLAKLSGLGEVVSRSKYLELRGKFSVSDLRVFSEIKRIIIIDVGWKRLDMKDLKHDCLRVLSRHKFKNYRVKTGFLDKIALSQKSVIKMINPFVKHEGFVPSEDSKNVLFIEFKKDRKDVFYRVGVFKEKELRSSGIDYSKFIVVVEEPRLVEELSDFIRVSHIFRLPLYIVTKDKGMQVLIGRALKITKGIVEPDIHIASKPPDCFLIGFSKLGDRTEKDLKILFNKEKIGLLFGNDTYGLSNDMRQRASILCHLTPDFKKPLRGSQALSYVLGLFTGGFL